VELTSALLAAQKSHCDLALLLLVPGTDGVAAHTRGHPLMSAKELLGEEFERSPHKKRIHKKAREIIENWPSPCAF
jgi:hypothetical protein